MKDKDFLNKIKDLKKIEPNQKWLNSSRRNFIRFIEENQEDAQVSSDGFFDWIWFHRLQPVVLTFCLMMMVIGGPWLTVKASRTSLPGDLLYSIKKINEKIQVSIASEDNKAQIKVDLVQRRLEELSELAIYSSPEEKNNRTKEAINSFKNELAGMEEYVGRVDNSSELNEIPEDLSKVKEKAPEETRDELAEVERIVEEYIILTSLIEQGDDAASTTDQIILPTSEETATSSEDVSDKTETTTPETIEK